MKRKYHILDRELCRSLHLSRQPHVRFGSKTDIGLSRHVRFTPKADITEHCNHVRFVPRADMNEVPGWAAIAVHHVTTERARQR